MQTETPERTQPLYRALAAALDAKARCEKISTDHARGMAIRWEARITRLVKEHMPRGSGFDCGTQLGADSDGNRLVFKTEFHHMGEDGGYDGWTEHTVRVTPSLVLEFALTISGRNRNGIKDYIAECFDAALRTGVTYGID